jgi:hypothetical protein
VRPGARVLDELGLDLVLGQVEREHGFPSGRFQTGEVELGQFNELALRVNPPQVTSRQVRL